MDCTLFNISRLCAIDAIRDFVIVKVVLIAFTSRVRELSLRVVLFTTSESCHCVSCSVLRQSVVAACRALYYVRVLSLRVVLCTTSECCRCVSCSVLHQSVVAACCALYYVRELSLRVVLCTTSECCRCVSCCVLRDPSHVQSTIARNADDYCNALLRVC